MNDTNVIIKYDLHNEQANEDINKITKIMIIISFFMVLELWGHWHSNSLSLLADSIHLLVDVLGFLVSLISLSLTKIQSNKKMSFGFHRFEVIGALVSIFSIWIATGYLIFESVKRFNNPKEINEKSFIMIAIIGFFVNLYCLFYLHSGTDHHRHEDKNLNMKATYVHIIGDLIQSSGVLLASTLTFFFPKIIFFDIAATIIFACIVMISTFIVMSEGINILLEAVPRKIPIKDVEKILLENQKVIEILELRIWSLSVSKHACMVRIQTENMLMTEYEHLLAEIKQKLFKIFHFSYITVQIETMNIRNLEKSHLKSHQNIMNK